MIRNMILVTLLSTAFGVVITHIYDQAAFKSCVTRIDQGYPDDCMETDDGVNCVIDEALECSAR